MRWWIGIGTLFLGAFAGAGPFVLPAAADLSDASNQDDDCVDSDGIWNPPDGLVIGGPESTLSDPAFATWFGDCGFFSESGVRVTMASCSLEDPSTCSGPGDPTSAYPGGELPIPTPYIHLGVHIPDAPDEILGSITVSRYIYNDDHKDAVADDPINVIFYGEGTATNVETLMTGTPGWNTMSQHGHTFGCNSDH